jgi:hypothetical protein
MARPITKRHATKSSCRVRIVHFPIGSILYAKNTPVKSKDGKFYLPGSAATATPARTGSADGPASTKKNKRKVSAKARARMSEGKVGKVGDEQTRLRQGQSLELR